MEKLLLDNIYVPHPLQRLFFILFFSLNFLFVTPLMADEQEPPLTEQAREALSNTPPETTLEQDIAWEQETHLEEDPLTRQQMQKIEQSESTAKDLNYNGGSTGTGRANMVFQTRLHIDALPVAWGIKPFNLNIQIQ